MESRFSYDTRGKSPVSEHKSDGGAILPIAMGFSTVGRIYLSRLSGAGDGAKVKKTVGTLVTLMLGLFWGAALSRLLPAFIDVGYFLSGRWKIRKLLVVRFREDTR